MDHLKVAIQFPARAVPSPRISIRLFFNNRLLLLYFSTRFAYLCCERKIGSGRKGWVYINKINLAREFFQERSKHQEIIAPYEFVSPASLESVSLPAIVHIEKTALDADLLHLTRGTALIDRLNDLERQV